MLSVLSPARVGADEEDLMLNQCMIERHGNTAGAFVARLSQMPRSHAGSALAPYLGRLLLLMCVLLGIAGDALAVYSPRTGRFLQKDPNESGMLHAEIWHGGHAPLPQLTVGELESIQLDGSNLFTFVRSSPFNGTDPQGLFLFVLSMVIDMPARMDAYIDYNDEIISNGRQAMKMTEPSMTGYAAVQDELITSLTDPIDGGSSGFRLLESGASLAMIGRVVGEQSHHILPHFLTGVTDPDGTHPIPLSSSEHKRYHRILREEFKGLNLDPPNTRGGRGTWRERFAQNKVPLDEVIRIRVAIRVSYDRFVAEAPPGVDPKGRYADLPKKVNALLSMDSVAPGIKRVRRR